MLCCQRVGDLESMAAAKDVLKNVFNKTKNQTEKKFVFIYYQNSGSQFIRRGN